MLAWDRPAVAQHLRPPGRIRESFWLAIATWCTMHIWPPGHYGKSLWLAMLLGIQCLHDQFVVFCKSFCFAMQPALFKARAFVCTSLHFSWPSTGPELPPEIAASLSSSYHQTLSLHLDQSGRNPENLHSTLSWLLHKPEPRGLYLGPSFNHHRDTATSRDVVAKLHHRALVKTTAARRQQHQPAT
jgi:hypothetical protein